MDDKLQKPKEETLVLYVLVLQSAVKLEKIVQ